MSTVDVTSFDLEALYQTHWHRMVRLAVLLVGDVAAAEDVVQDAFLGLQRHQSSVPSDGAALSYLRRSIVNGSHSVIRKRMTARRHAQSITAQAEPAADYGLIIAAEHDELVRALRRLPRRQREVLILRYWSRLSEAEIAATLGVSTGTVKSTASRGIDRLAQALKERK